MLFYYSNIKVTNTAVAQGEKATFAAGCRTWQCYLFSIGFEGMQK